jgi:septum formation protein
MKKKPPGNFPSLLLASRSPRRRGLLSDIGFDLEIADIDIDESYPTELTGHEVAEYLATRKADAYRGDYGSRVLVCADTIVVLDNQVINKPESQAHACEMLRRLSGRTHHVYTGVCLKTPQKERVFSEKTAVTFRFINPEEIEYYVQEFKPLDKAGAYGIQDWLGYTCVTGVQGCFYNVMGFPMARFYKELYDFAL